MNIKKLAGISLACSALGLSAAPAQAGLVLQLDDGVSPLQTIADGSASDLNPLANVVTFMGSIGIWDINVSTAISKAPSGESGIDLNSIDHSTSKGSLTISMWTDAADFTSPPAGLNGLLNAFGGTTVGSVSVGTYINTGAPAPLPTGAPWTLVTSQGPLSGPSFSGDAVGGVNILGAFDLGQVVKITHDGVGTTSFDSAVQVSEPTILGLLGLGLLGIGFARRRRAA